MDKQQLIKEYTEMKLMLDKTFEDPARLNIAALQLLYSDYKSITAIDGITSSTLSILAIFEKPLKDLMQRYNLFELTTPLSTSQLLQWKQDLSYAYSVVKEQLYME